MSDATKTVAGAIIDLSAALGITHINKLPGCHEHQVDERWSLAVNGHLKPMRTSKGNTLEPLHVIVYYNGWPAGVFHIAGDGWFAAGTGANEDAFIAACAKAAEEVSR